MSRVRIVGGTIAKHTVGKHNMYAEENIVFHSGKVVSEKGDENGVTYGKSKTLPIVEKKQGKVKKIELITNLDLGSKNDKSGGTQLGMVFGKSYTFKVTQYENETSVSRKLTKWQMRYHSPKFSKNKWIDIPLKVTGDKVTLKMNEEDMCGRFIYIRAYIDDPKTEGEYKQWKHNRFRWFDRMIIYEQAEARSKAPWMINQENSSLCGMAALYNVLIKKDSSLYLKIAKELYRTGEVTVNNFEIKPHKEAYSMYDMNPNSSDYKTVKMPEVDWIVLATTRSREAFLFDKLVYKGVERDDMDMIKAVNWPEMMQQMTRNVANFSTVEIFGLNKFLIQQKKRPLGGRIYDYFSDSDLEHLQNIDNKFKKGNHILMMIDSNMIENIVSYSYNDIFRNSHWVVYEGDLSFYDGNKKITNTLSVVKFVSFKIFTWGFNPNNSYKDVNNVQPSSKYKLLQNKYVISSDCFKSTFYGYIEAF